MSEKLPKDWKRVKLGEIAELSTHTWKVGGEKLPYIGLEHIDENRLRINSIGSSDDVSSNKFIFTEKEFLFGKLRPYFRKLYNPTFKGICSTDIWVVRPKENVDKNFLFYLFATREFIDLSYNGASGTRMPRADWKFVKNSEWIIPEDINEQRAIAEVLSSLDDKIDLLHRQNQTLEQMAETLFRKWFVEGAKEEWEEKGLDEIAEFLNGLACQKYPKKYGEVGLPVIKIKEMRNGITENSDWTTADVPEKYIVHDGDLLFSWSGSLDIVLWFGAKAVLNQHIFKVSSNHYPQWFYYFWVKYYLPEFRDIAEDKATTMGHIQRQHLSDTRVLIPSDKELKKMDEIVDPMFQKIKSNMFQIRTLEKLRDTLLPKLMRGEIKVQL